MDSKKLEVKEKTELTIKTAKGLVSEPFKAKDGNEYRRVKIPNRDENDKAGWGSFVLRANNIRDDKFGKGMWFKVPEEGTTTVSRPILVGRDENGKNVYENTSERVSNKELKSMVEYYKERDKDISDNRKSFSEQLSSAKKESAEKSKEKVKQPKSKSKEKSL